MRFTAMNRAQSGKMALTAAALGLGLLTVTGCGYINPQQTTHQYAASDGIRADLGPLQLRNILIVSAGEDEPGRLLGAVYNSSSQDVKLTVNGAEGSQTEVPVKANSYTLLNDSTDEAILSTTGGIAGSLVDVKVTRGRHQRQQHRAGARPGRHAARSTRNTCLPAATPSPSTSASPSPSASASGAGH